MQTVSNWRQFACYVKSYFLEKIQKKIITLSSAEFAHSIVSVKGKDITDKDCIWNEMPYQTIHFDVKIKIGWIIRKLSGFRVFKMFYGAAILNI